MPQERIPDVVDLIDPELPDPTPPEVLDPASPDYVEPYAQATRPGEAA